MARAGMFVEFVASNEEAKEIFLTTWAGGNANADSKRIVCGILGILLGVFGVHKFYLNAVSEGNAYTTPAVMMLIGGTIGWFLVLPGLASLVIGIAEGVIYLTKSEEEFRQIYLIDSRTWF